MTARLTQGGYVFPVYGPAGFGDTFGASRPNVSGGWHHGEDIVAPLGTPLLAVTDGTLFSVGWNDIGGWRLWLRDDAGNEFYYAHLSAYSTLAVSGRRVRAGDVVGFLGKSGDAEASIPHLHFEIHPASLLSLGYDGVVAPYPFLIAWRRADDVAFGSGRQYIRDGLPIAAPRAGAVLLEASDISATSGLVPGRSRTRAPRRAVAPTRRTTGGAVEAPPAGRRGSVPAYDLLLPETAASTFSAVSSATSPTLSTVSATMSSKPSNGWRSSLPAIRSSSMARVWGPVHGL